MRTSSTPIRPSRSTATSGRYRELPRCCCTATSCTPATGFDKLLGLHDIEQVVPELNPRTQDAVQASTSTIAPFTPRVKALLVAA